MFKFWEAVLMLSGMIIGVGVFGIPFSFVQSGFVLGAIELLILAVVISSLHVLYGEIVLGTPGPHRLPGYVNCHLGPGAARLSQLSALFGMGGTLLVYAILGGIFLRSLLSPYGSTIPEYGWVVIMVTMVACITLMPLRRMAFINGLLTLLLIVFILVLTGMLWPRVTPANLSGFDLSRGLVPYGVLNFALSGAVIIPDMMEIFGRDKKRALRAIRLGSWIPAAVYFLFALAIVGTAGSGVTADAISGLQGYIGPGVIRLGSLIGFLAVITSYIVLHVSFGHMLEFDFRLGRVTAIACAIGLPLVLYVAGMRNVITIMGAVGAVALGIDSSMIIASYARMRSRRGERMKMPTMLGLWLVFGLFAVGIIYELSVLF